VSLKKGFGEGMGLKIGDEVVLHVQERTDKNLMWGVFGM